MLLAVNRAEAANVAVIATAPGILNVMILAVACAGMAIGFQVLSVVKGGRLSRSWQLFVAGFGVLILAQILVLIHCMEVLSLPGWAVPALLVLMSGIFAYGVFLTKRVLG